MQQNIYIVSATRTPIGDFGGSLVNVSATELAVLVIQSAIKRAQIEKDLVDLVFMGNCFDPIADNISRIAAVKGGLPVKTPGITISATCGSGMQAVAFGFQAIRDGEAGIVVAGGVESMSMAPFISTTNRWGARLRHAEMFDLIWKAMQDNPLGCGMGMTAEKIAERDGITREDQDELALTSQARAVRAIKEGRFRDEITPVEIHDKRGGIEVFDTDEHPRETVTIEQLAKLPPAFKKRGTVTAGNSSGINDGAAAVILMSGEKVRELGIHPMARIVEKTVVGVDPDYMGDGPIPATREILEKTGLTLKDIGLFEINEAFAAPYLACERALGLNREITNVNGSGIALGHPVGCTGCRLIVTLVHEMKKRGENLGLATLCAGGGHGFATIIENA
ncbi:MAG: thiolase family protein [Desulfobacteraceae bacterium]|nr:MAG: thiolase family protein [Desulfobacteraceae bacterium]